MLAMEASEMATIPDSHENIGIKDEAMLEVEYPVQLAHTTEPVLRLAGTVSVIRTGRRDLALSDQEWRDLGLEDMADAG
jgi:hypothetical protein